MNSHCSHRYSGTTVATATAYSGTLSYVRTPAIAAALESAIAAAIAATIVTAIADGDLLHGWNSSSEKLVVKDTTARTKTLLVATE